MPLAWQAATPEQKNKLAVELFEAVWVRSGVIEAVTPRPEMVPFFDLAHEQAVKDKCHWRTRPDSNRRSRP